MASKSSILSVKIVGDSRDLQNSLKLAGNAITAFTRNTTKIAALTTAALSSAGTLLTLGKSLLTVAGAGIALPGLFLGMATGVGVMMLALKDTGTVLADLGPAFGKLQKTVSGNFWAVAAQPIREMVSTLLPQLESGMGKVATSLGGFFSTFAASIRTAFTGGGASLMPMLFDTTAKSIDIAKGALAPLTNAFIVLGSVGIPLLPKLAQGFVDLAKKFSDWITGVDSDGSLKRWMDAGIQGLKDLGGLVGNVLKIFGGLTAAADKAGGTTLKMLSDGLGKVADVVNGPAFQGGLTALFKGASGAMDGVLKALGPISDLFAALAPAVSDILPLLGELAGTALSGLAQALTPVAEGLGKLADWATKNPDAFKAIASAILGMVAAVWLVNAAVAVFNAVLALNPLSLVVLAVGALIAVIIYLATQTTFFQDVWKAVTDFCKTAWSAMTTWISQAWTNTVTFLQDTLKNIQNFFKTVFSAVGSFVLSIVNNIKTFFSVGFAYVKSVIQGHINNIRTIIGWISSTVSSVVSGVRNFFSSAFSWVVGIVSGAIGNIRNIIGWISSTASGVANTVRNVFTGAFNVVRNAVTPVIDGIRNAFDGISGAVQNAISWVSNLFNGFSLPGWLSKVMSFMGVGATGFSIDGGFDMTGLAAGLGATGSLLSLGSMGGSSKPMMNNTYINVEIKAGVGDPVEIGRQVDKVLNTYKRTAGIA